MSARLFVTFAESLRVFVALALRFSLIVLIVVTRPRVIDGPGFLCNSAYLGECCFFRVIGTGKRVSIRIED